MDIKLRRLEKALSKEAKQYYSGAKVSIVNYTMNKMTGKEICRFIVKVVVTISNSEKSFMIPMCFGEELRKLNLRYVCGFFFAMLLDCDEGE